MEQMSQTGANDGESELSQDVPAAEGNATGDPYSDASSADPSGTGADQSQDVAPVDDETAVRELDYESPEAVAYLGHGLCLGAVLGLVFTSALVSGNWGGSGRE